MFIAGLVREQVCLTELVTHSYTPAGHTRLYHPASADELPLIPVLILLSYIVG